MTKAIIFDIGSTVLKNDWQSRVKAIYKETGILEYRKGNMKRLSRQMSLGKISLKYLLKMQLKESDVPATFHILLQSYEKNYAKYSSIDKNMIKLVKILRKSYKVYAFSNTNDIHEKINKKRGLFSHFDKSFLSNRIHLRKPDRRAFAYVKKSINIPYKEMVFIDDDEKNIKTAKKLGILSIYYTTYPKLIKSLKHLGVKT